MPRKPRLTHPGYYHVLSRGVERRRVFLEKEDFHYFLTLLAHIKDQFSITVHAFCLMDNHYHVLVQTHHENISEAMQYLNANYSAWFNRKYKRSGHLWQGRYKSYLLFDDIHFWNVARYIERNPLAAGMVRAIDEYPYHSLRLRMMDSTNISLLEGSLILDMDSDEYRSFVNTPLDDDCLKRIYKSPRVVIHDDGRMEVLTKRIGAFLGEDGSSSRNQKIADAFDYGYSQTEIAEYLGMSVTAVSKILAQNSG